MKLLIITLFIGIVSFSGYGQTKSSSKKSISLQTGYNRGFGFMGSYTILQKGYLEIYDLVLE